MKPEKHNWNVVAVVFLIVLTFSIGYQLGTLVGFIDGAVTINNAYQVNEINTYLNLTREVSDYVLIN